MGDLLFYYKATLQLLKFFFALYILYFYHIYGFVLMSLSLHFFYYLLRVTLSLNTLSSGDYLFVDWRKYNLVHVTEFTHLDTEKVIEDLYERGIKLFPRFRQKLVFFIVDWFFQDVSLEEAKKQIKIVKNENLVSKQQIFEYGNKLSAKFFEDGDIHIDFTIVENKNGSGVLFIRLDHVITDGTGFMGVLNTITSHKEKNLESIHFSIPWRVWLYSVLWFPVFFVKLFYRHSYYIPNISPPSAFKSGNKFTDITKFSKTKNFSLEKAKVFYRTFKGKVTLNDLILGVVSVSMSRYFKSINKYTENKFFLATVPVNTKEVPEKIHEIKLDNMASGVIAILPLSENLDWDLLQAINKESKRTSKDPRYIFTSKYINSFFSFFTPKFIWDKIISYTLNSLDLNISNVSGPNHPVYVGDCQAVDSYMIPPIGGHKVFMVIQSYKGEFSLTMRCDSSIECEPTEFIKIVEEVFEEILK